MTASPTLRSVVCRVSSPLSVSDRGYLPPPGIVTCRDLLRVANCIFLLRFLTLPCNQTAHVVSLTYEASNCNLELAPSFRFPCVGTNNTCERTELRQFVRSCISPDPLTNMAFLPEDYVVRSCFDGTTYKVLEKITILLGFV
jgi:hypothetical protein